MSMQSIIQQKIRDAIQPSHLEVIDETGNHNVPAGSESHFKVIVVADQFHEKSLIARHRLINEILAQELAGQIHALSIHAYTNQEWSQRNQAPASPPCMGGGKQH